MIVLTQSLIECGLTNLVPIGIVRHDIYGWRDEGPEQLPRDLERVNEALGKVYPDIDFVLNTKFEIYCSGHPSRGYRNCIITGDGYKIK